MKIGYHLALFRREFLQHNGALWITPLVLMGLMQIGAMYSSYLIITEVGLYTSVTIDSQEFNLTEDFNSLVNNSDFQFQPGYAFLAFAAVVCVFYLLDSLYSDRKDRSILFWRSLPVSEYENVAVKLVTASVLIPGVFLLIGLISSLLAACILYIGVSISGLNLEGGTFILYVSGLASIVPLLITTMLLSVFLIPLYLSFLFVSSVARKSPWLMLILPVLGVTIVELMIFQEPKLIEFVGLYLQDSIELSLQIVKGEFSGISVVNVLLAAVFSIVVYFVCVFLRLRKFEI